MRGGPGRALEPALHVRFEFADERRMGELVREYRGDAERYRRRNALFLERLQRLDQRQIAVERGFAEPHAPVRPAAVMEDVRQMTVERQDEIHGGPNDGR